MAEDGASLVLQERTSAPKLKEGLLEQLLREELGDAFDDLWSAITKRTLDPEKLEMAVHSGRIPHSVLEKALDPGKTTYARLRTPWTKSDRQLIDDRRDI